jgi:serine protease Do
MTPDLARRAHVDAQTKGVVVTDIQPDSPNAGEGLEPGDVLVEVNRTPIATVADYRKALKGLKPGSTALLRVKRGTQAEYLTVRVPG